MPVDKSWVYGYVGRWLLDITGHLSSLIALQAFMFWAAAAICLRRFLTDHYREATVCLIATFVGSDPLIQAYTKFWLSDIAAMAFFVAFVVCIQRPFLDAGLLRAADWLLLL